MVLLGALGLFLAEVAAFVAVGDRIGYGLAVLLLVGLSLLGPFMIRRVGLGVLARTRQRLGAGELPSSDLLDGVVVLIGGLLICVPGLITDLVGLILMIRPARQLVLRRAQTRLTRRIETMPAKSWKVVDVSAHRRDGEPRGPMPSEEAQIESHKNRDA